MKPYPVLLTRPQLQSERFAAQYRAHSGAGSKIVISPLLEIFSLPGLLHMQGITGLVFTSENAVRQFAAQEATRGLPVWCVGPRTAEVARDLGFHVVATSGKDVAALAAQIIRDAPVGPLLHPRGRYQAGNLTKMVEKAGIELRTCEIYDQRAVPLSAEGYQLLAGTTPVLVPVFSPRSARLLRAALVAGTAPLRIAALSPAVAEALDLSADIDLRVASRPNGVEMLKLLNLLGAA